MLADVFRHLYDRCYASKPGAKVLLGFNHANRRNVVAENWPGARFHGEHNTHATE
jgi:hypothetical protein